MNIRWFFSALLCAALFVACESDGTTSGSTIGGSDQDTSTGTEEVPNGMETVENLPETYDCTVEGDILEENQFWARASQRLLVIKADAETADANLGPSHRIFEVYNTENCERVRRTVMEVNRSPDFPYYLAEKLYNNSSKLVAISGFSNIYVYDIEADRLSEPMQPDFGAGREGVDAQSGMIRRLEVWEDFLIGYSQDMGTFVFDFRDKTAPKPILPFAEDELEGGEFGSLFLLPSQSGGMQALIPRYDLNEDVFAINPLLDAPRELDTNIPKSARNNRFLVMRDAADKAYAFDLKTAERVNLPANMQTAKSQDVLAWMRTNRN